MKVAFNLPTEWRELATLNAQVAQGNLTSEELQRVCTQLVPLLGSTSDKVVQLAKQIFDMVVALEQQLIERDMGLIQQLQSLEAHVQMLWLQMDTLTPEEMAEELIALEKELVGLRIPFSPRLRAKYRTLGDEVEKLHFRFVFPIAFELEEEGMFASELSQIAERLEQSTRVVGELSTTQRKEILALAGQGISPEGLSHATHEYLASLRAQRDIAQMFFAGRVDAGFQALLDLPEEVRIRIDELIWEAAGGVPIDPTLPESHALMAAAILQSMEERMGFYD